MDPILYWNEVSLEANRVSHTDGKDVGTLGPTLSSRALAIVHLAMYDAFAGVSGNPPDLPHYLTPGPVPPVPGASVEAAVAAAAHATLSKLFPSQKPFFDLKHLQAGLGGSGLNEGHQFGLLVAQKLLEDRKDDPNASDDGYAASVARGAHRPDPDNPGQGFHAPFYGAQSKGFAITARHELATPPFDNPEYRKALREVRGKGIAPELMGTLPKDIEARTVDETLVGIFWAYDGASEIGTPPRLYNQIVRRVAEARNNSVTDNARLFAFVNVAMADAGILAWDQKYIHDLWRPVVGIREHDKSMGPEATQADNDISDNCDTSWLPLGAPNSNRLAKNVTPNFPAYPSGHATFGAAAFHITRLFYGVSVGDRARDDLFKGLDFVSDEFNGVTTDNKGAVRPRHLRNFDHGLWQMIEENGRSRVDLGVHWVFDAFVVKDDGTPDLARKDAAEKPFGGVPLGLLIAEDIFQAGGGKAPKKSTVGPRP
jgi:hypothetical protein